MAIFIKISWIQSQIEIIITHLYVIQTELANVVSHSSRFDDLTIWRFGERKEKNSCILTCVLFKFRN
jgi:hypothetical protein